MNSEPAKLNKRQAELVKIVTREGYATIEALALRFNTSQQTIRRDIIALDERQILQRFHGGVGVINEDAQPLSVEVQNPAIEATQAIADTAAQWVKAKMTVFIDVGATAEALAHSLLANNAAFRVVTSSLVVALILTEQTQIETIVVAGSVKTLDGAVIGDLATSVVNMFKYDYAFISFSGFDADGSPMDFDINKVLVKQAAIRRADAVVGIADANTYRRQASVRLMDAGDLTYFISDTMPHADLNQQLVKAGVQVVVAQPAAAASTGRLGSIHAVSMANEASA